MKATVFLIEDDQDTRLALQDSIEDAGYQVEAAANGSEGWWMLQNKAPPSLIVVDLNMPILNGDEFLKKLAAEPRFADIPVIQISASSTQQRARATYSLGKPLDPDDLLQLVNACLWKLDAR